MLGRLGEAPAFEETAKAVEGPGRDRDGSVGNPILVELGNGTVISLVFQENLHRLLPLIDHSGVVQHIRHADAPGEPFVPMAIVILLKTTVGNQVAVRGGKNGEWG